MDLSSDEEGEAKDVKGELSFNNITETPFRPVGRRGSRPSTSTPAVRPQRLSFLEELAAKQREMGRSADSPSNFGVRPVSNPRVSFNLFQCI